MRLRRDPNGEWIAYSDAGVVLQSFPSEEAAKLYQRQMGLADTRRCGECTVCCHALAIPELQKPTNSPCQHLGGRCTIYKQRPQRCRTYFCAWRNGIGEDEDRPDRGGLLLTAHESVAGFPPITFVVHEAWPNASRRPEATALLAQAGGMGIICIVNPETGLASRVIGPSDLLVAARRYCLTNGLVFPFGILVDYKED
jgi:hypothetical protein